MQVTFGRVAYVANTDDYMLDRLENSPLSVSMTGEEIVVVTRESIEEFLKNYDKSMEEYQRTAYRSIKEFLQQTLNTIDKANDGTPIGDIIFTS